ncbi:2-dehydro-3-deoxygalactonokinase [Azohydromonas caseinilytica]|uniref:2-dehydro-3-deoxygalactonokinase n=1 Tax=Azohydromonas caseinilytica TaxID=2728836 RepID=UPI00197C2D46|nr:2-dehydro-3-deoxygalactonokinase [Azohydromonas caseinilytica]
MNRRGARPALVALDWGTSSLRAFLMDAAGAVVAERASSQGLRHLPQPGHAGFTQALSAIAGDWLRDGPRLPLVACGMVGSAQGWREAPYVGCPADVTTLAAHAARVDDALGRPLWIAPGLLYAPGNEPPDVMRGEEIQIAGALARQPQWARRACLVLPGTHSKWAWVEDGRVTTFRTAMTGEVYAVLRQHSLLGQLMSEGESEPAVAAAAFNQGVERARASRPGDLTHELFAVRTLGLTGRLPGPALADYLSGLLIGHEIVSALAQPGMAAPDEMPLLLVGEAALSRRYAQALAAFGRAPAAELGNTAPQGLWRFAGAAGLIGAAA